MRRVWSFTSAVSIWWRIQARIWIRRSIGMRTGKIWRRCRWSLWRIFRRGTEAYFGPHPFLTEEAALFLRSAGAALVGIDSLNIDDRADLRRPVHSILLGAEIPIVEHMANLAALPEASFRFYAVPPKVRGFGTFPVRAFALA